MKIPRGIKNKNPGNLVLTTIPWKGKVPNKQNTDGHFEQFYDIRDGIRAMIMDIRSDIRKGRNTLVSLINEYAPKNENNTNAYIKTVSRLSRISPNELLSADKETMCKLVRAMSYVENGGHFLTNQQIEEAWNRL